jgi:hypothetical protein
VKLVILVHLHKSDSRSTTKRVVIEFRERDPNNPTISCESTSCPTLEWRSATDVTDLNIPAELVYDLVPSFITVQGTPHFVTVQQVRMLLWFERLMSTMP